MAVNSDQVTENELRRKALAIAADDTNVHPRLFYILVAALVVCMIIGAFLFLSKDGTSAPADAQAAPTPLTTEDPTPDAQAYGQANPQPQVAAPARALSAQVANAVMPSSTPLPAQSQEVNSAIESYRRDLQNLASAQTTSDAGTVPAIGGPHLAQVYGGTSASGAYDPASGTAPAQSAPSSNDAIGALRNQIMAEEQQLVSAANGLPNAMSSIAQGQSVPPASAAASPRPAAAQSSSQVSNIQLASRQDGAMGTPQIAPETYELPMGTRIPAVLDGAMDSSLSGPVRAHILQDMRDPRSGALVIPKGAWLLGHFIGLNQGQDHLAVSWDWLVYPNLWKRPLSAVATTDEEGSSGLGGKVDPHLWKQFRDTLIGSIVSNAGAIVAGAVSHGNGTYIGSPVQSTTITYDVPTLYAGRTTEFMLALQADYDVSHPYDFDDEVQVKP